MNKGNAAQLATFLIGVLFALGLGLSGMTQPQKVLAFLNLRGNWDPSLLFVLGGAVVTYFFSFILIRKRGAPMLTEKFSLPTKRTIDRNLVFGSVLFGIGWGVAGFCPGPALAMLVTGNHSILVFVLSMTVGMFVFESLSSRFSEPDGGVGIDPVPRAK